MPRGDHSLKRSAAAAADAKPNSKKAKTGPPPDVKTYYKKTKPGSAAAKPDFKKKTNANSTVPAAGKSGVGKKGDVPRSLSDAVAKDKKDRGLVDGNGAKDGKEKKPFKKRVDGGKPKHRKEKKAPMTPAERRASKPNFALVEGLKSHWNTVRIKATSAAVREKLVSQMAAKMEGQVLQVTLRHDASRIVESILQYGTEKQREKILTELTSKLVEIAKTPYGHFVVLKAITYCTGASEQKKIAAAFVGHFVSLGAHVIGARTVESIMQIYASKFTRGLKAEFYGSKFVVLAPEKPRNLIHLLEQLPSKASSLIDHMRDLVQKFVDKGLMEFSFVHNLLWEYTQQIVKEVVDTTAAAGKKSRIEDLVNQLVESGPKLMSTKPGAKAMCLVVTHAGVKERKRIMKTLKGHTLESLLHDSAFLAIMRLVDVTDDTVTVQKSLLEEIRSPLADIKYTATGEIIGSPYPPLISIAKHRNGNKFLLRLLSPDKKCFEPGDETDLFATVPPTSKKLPAVRRREHLAYLKAPLIQVCAQYAGDLVRCRSGGRVLEELVRTYFPSTVLDSIARIFAGLEVDVSPVNEEDMSAYGGGDDDEEEEEEEEEEGDHEGEGGDEEGDENEEEEEAMDEDDNELEEDGMEEEMDVEEPAGQAQLNAAPVVELLAIQEDPVAHLLLKKILLLEAASEVQSGAVSVGSKKIEKNVEGNAENAAVDMSLWVTEEGKSSGQFAAVLLKYLQQEDLLKTWVLCNRPCFALSNICNVPSARVAALLALKPYKKEIEATASAHSGGKVLLESMI